MKEIFFLLFTCISISSFSQENDPSDVLVGMLMNDEFIEAREYHQLHSTDIVENIELLYKYKMCGFLNQPDSSAYYLERFIKEYPQSMPGDYAKIMFFSSLIHLYGETENYLKALETCKLFEHWLSTSLPSADSIWRKGVLPQIMEQRSILERTVKTNIPIMKIENISGQKTSSIDIQTDLLINAVLDYNGVKGKTWIDTGMGCALYMNKTFADKCRLKKHTFVSTSDSILVNGVLTRADMCIVDSLKIGGLLITNVPAYVVYNKYSSMLSDSMSITHAARFDSVFSLTDVILGLPILRRLGSVEFDWKKNKMNVEARASIPIKQGSVPNMFITSPAALYGCITIDSLNYVGLMDTGARQITLSVSSSFYERNRNYLSSYLSTEIIKKTMYGMSSVDEESYLPIVISEVVFAGRNLQMEKGDVLLGMEKFPLEWKDGLIGLPFFKKLGSKVKFDFVNMKVTSEGLLDVVMFNH